jgi:hypothetical protein
MLKTAILCGLTLYQAAGAADLVSAVLYNASVPPHTRPPIYDKGYLIFTYRTGDSAVTVYGPNGTRLFGGLVKLPRAGAIQLGNSAADSDGTIAVTVAYGSAQEPAGAIAVFDHSGRQTGFFETGRYLPAALAFDPDHMLWALGWQRGSDYAVFRKFARDGKEAGAFVSRSSFPPGLEPGHVAAGEKGIMVAHGRMGALVASGKAGDQREWVELDLSGKLLGRWRMDHLFTVNLGFTASGDLYGCAPHERGQPTHLTEFDRATSSWKPVPGYVRPDWLLMGADGDRLVLWDQGTSPMLLRYMR